MASWSMRRRWKAARNLIREARDLCVTYEPSSSRLYEITISLIDFDIELGKLDKAQSTLTELTRMLEADSNPHPLADLDLLRLQGRMLSMKKDYAAAEPLLRQAAAGYAKSLTEKHPTYGQTQMELAEVCLAAGKPEVAMHDSKAPCRLASSVTARKADKSEMFCTPWERFTTNRPVVSRRRNALNGR